MRALFYMPALLTLTCCNPGAGLYDGGTIAITARVLNPRPIIHLGDSVAFYFEVPDSITLNGTRIAVSAGSKDGATIGFDANKINPSAVAGFQINSPSCQIYANPGSLTANNTLFFTNRNGKLLAKYYLIPKKKGIYFFEQSQLGYADLNNRSLLLNFSIDFGKVDRSHQMLIDSAGAANRFDLYLKGRTDGGLEVYGFRVI
jgi:hypothetical protein